MGVTAGIEYAVHKVSRTRGLVQPHALAELRTTSTSTGFDGTVTTWSMNAGVIETATACDLAPSCNLQVELARSPFTAYDVP